MAETTNIEWADATFNPWIGCTKVSDGCDRCYAEVSTPSRVHGISWGPGAPRHRTSIANWRKPLAWNLGHKAFAAAHGRRRRVFCASLGDVFDNAVDLHWRRDLFDLIELTPHLDWLLLTKRIGNVQSMVREAKFGSWLESQPNVWLGATIVNQTEADRDIPKLLDTPAQVRFLSMEPLLGPVRLPEFCACGCRLPWERAVSDAMRSASALNREQAEASVMSTLGVDWVIVGGESGANARPMHPYWVRDLRDQCTAAGVPFLLKQWGEWTELDTGLPEALIAREGDPEFDQQVDKHVGFISLQGHFVTDADDMSDNVLYRGLVRPGKKAAGRMLDGRTHDDFPKVRP